MSAPDHDPYVPPHAELIEGEDDGSQLRAELMNRPLSVGEVASHTWSIFTAHLGPLLAASAIVYFPINLVLSLWAANATGFPEETMMAGFRLSTLLYGLVGIVATLVAIKVTVDAVDGREVSFRSALGGALRFWGRSVGANIIAGLIIFGLCLCLIVPGIIWAVYYTFVLQVVVATDKGAGEALTYSKKLVQGRWWSVLGFSAASWLILVFMLIVETGLLFALDEVGVTHPLLESFTGGLNDTLSSICTVFITIYFLNLHMMRQREQQEILDEPDEDPHHENGVVLEERL